MWFRTRNNTIILYNLTFRDLTLNIVYHNHRLLWDWIHHYSLMEFSWNVCVKSQSSKSNKIIFVSREGNSLEDWFGWRQFVSFNLFTCFGLGVRDVIQSIIHDDPAGIHKDNWNSAIKRNENKQKFSKNPRSKTITLSHDVSF